MDPEENKNFLHEHFLDNEKIRCFVAIELPKNLCNEILRIQKFLKKKTHFTGKITEFDNLHLTLKFLGEIEEKNLVEIIERLKVIKWDSFKAYPSDLGIFYHKKDPRIVWIRLGGKGVMELQKKIDSLLDGMYEPEGRFMSHITIARIKHVKDKEKFVEHISNVKSKNFEFNVNEIYLKKSELYKEGPIYSDIMKFEPKLEK